jgi:hypothetical protein
MPAKDDRQVRLLQRLGFHGNFFEVPVTPLETRLRLRPKKLHDLHCFVKAGYSPFPAVAKNILMGSEMAATEPDAQHRAAPAHHVQARVRLG